MLNNPDKIRRLVIDIGTNSILALLAEVSDGTLGVIFDEKKTTRLGQGLAGSGSLSRESMSRTVEAIDDFLKKDDFDSVILLGTEALRIASNSAEFIDMVKSRCGERVHILTGSKEAELNYLGALYGLNIVGEGICIIDVGGGSTEIAFGDSASMNVAASLPIGAAKLYELSDDDKLDFYIHKASTEIQDRMSGMEYSVASDIIATGGTITSLAALRMGSKIYDPAGIHGSSLSVKEIERISSEFEGLDSNEKTALIPFDPQRAELILPGAGIFLAILGIIKKDTVIVSTGGLRYGAVLFPERVFD